MGKLSASDEVSFKLDNQHFTRSKCANDKLPRKMSPAMSGQRETPCGDGMVEGVSDTVHLD